MRFGLVICLQILFANGLFAQSRLFKNPKGNYLGQPPPGNIAALFAPGLVSTDSIEHSSPTFSPDGNLVLWTKIFRGKPAFIVEMKYRRGKWTKPQSPSFSYQGADDFYPTFSPNGKKLYFSSRRKHFLQPSRLDDKINSSGYEDGPFIAPDESYLIFESQRPESIDGSIDLYICFKQKDGSWSVPKNMGPTINTKYTERFAMVSPDGKYLFFGSNRKQQADNLFFDIYWIDAGIIQRLKDDGSK